jgi:hypothetical protein
LLSEEGSKPEEEKARFSEHTLINFLAAFLVKGFNVEVGEEIEK